MKKETTKTVNKNTIQFYCSNKNEKHGNAVFTKYKILTGKTKKKRKLRKKDLKPKITKLRSHETTLNETHVTYDFFWIVIMYFYQLPRFLFL